jgi:hypothetical protein
MPSRFRLASRLHSIAAAIVGAFLEITFNLTGL